MGYGVVCGNMVSEKRNKGMKIQTLTIPEIPESLNVILAMHYMARSKYRNALQERIYYEARQQKIKKVKRCKLFFTIHFTTNRYRDIDNFLMVKYMVDSLRYAGIIPDDDSETVQAITVDFAYGDDPRTDIVIEEV